MDPIDFGEVKRCISVIGVLYRMGWRERRREPSAWRGRCVLEDHTDREGRAMAVTPDGWYCHRCRRGGDVIRLVMELHGVDAIRAALWLCGTFGLAVPRRAGRRGTEKRNG